jgi:hypothetical protein
MDSEQSHLKTRSFSPLLLLLLVLAPRLVFAQEPAHSLQELQSRVRIGDTIRIFDIAGKQTQGKFDGLAGSSLRIQVKGITREFREPLIRQIDLKYADPLSDGLRKGAIIGAAAGIVFGFVVVAAEGCESSSCRMGAGAVSGAIGAGVGAASGALSDSIKQRYTTVFSPPRTTANRWGISPVLSWEWQGVKIAIHF